MNPAFSKQGDFDLVNSVFKEFAKRQPTIAAGFCGREERVVTLAWQSLGLIQNGGFEYLLSGTFKGDADFSNTLAAYREIGASAAADCLQGVLSTTAGAPGPDQRAAQFLSLPKVDRDAVEERFSDQREGIVAALASYIRRNQQALNSQLNSAPK